MSIRERDALGDLPAGAAAGVTGDHAVAVSSDGRAGALDRLAIDTIRTLSIDAVQEANSATLDGPDRRDPHASDGRRG